MAKDLCHSSKPKVKILGSPYNPEFYFLSNFDPIISIKDHQINIVSLSWDESSMNYLQGVGFYWSARVD